VGLLQNSAFPTVYPCGNAVRGFPLISTEPSCITDLSQEIFSGDYTKLNEFLPTSLRNSVTILAEYSGFMMESCSLSRRFRGSPFPPPPPRFFFFSEVAIMYEGRSSWSPRPFCFRFPPIFPSTPTHAHFHFSLSGPPRATLSVPPRDWDQTPLESPASFSFYRDLAALCDADCRAFPI